MLKRRVLATATGCALLGGIIMAAPAPAAVGTDSSAFRSAVTVDGVRGHQAALQSIADSNGGTRAASTPGYDASAQYVFDSLEAAGYSPVVQEFDFPLFEETAPPVFEQVSPNPTAYAVDSDFSTMEFSASGDVTANLQAAGGIVLPPSSQPSSASGCQAADFSGFVAGNVALIQRGTCTFQEKALNAIASGASGVVIFNEGQAGRTDTVFGTLGSPEGITVPVIGATFDVGNTLYGLLQSGAVQVHLSTSTISEIRTTHNVYADTSGNAKRTIVVGGHLDSVPEGPGIQDNGSGSATVLEIAEQFSELSIHPTNRVRFAWWGAEEQGLLGSQYYVDQLSARDIKNTMANLNFDMVGSPNFVRFVYDGDGSATAVAGPNGSKNIEKIFLDYFKEQGLATEPTAFDGRSDYGPFIAVGIPAGGLFTGAEGIKTPDEAEIYGGTAGVAYDPCYHQACDTFDNVNLTGLDQMVDAAADATLQLAMTTSAVNGTDKSSTRAMENADEMAYSGSRLRK